MQSIAKFNTEAEVVEKANATEYGLSAAIFFYVSINLMMVMGLAPVVGVPLPLVSFGGSAVMTVMLCLGLLMALERHQRTGSTSSLA